MSKRLLNLITHQGMLTHKMAISSVRFAKSFYIDVLKCYMSFCFSQKWADWDVINVVYCD